MVRLALAGEFQQALVLHQKYHKLFGDLFIETNPIPIKAAMAMKNLIEEEYRLPMCKLEDANREILKASLEAAGLL